MDARELEERDVGTLLDRAWVSVVRGCDEGVTGILVYLGREEGEENDNDMEVEESIRAEAGQRLTLVCAGEITDVSGASATRRPRGDLPRCQSRHTHRYWQQRRRELSRNDDHQYAEELDPVPSRAREG